MSADAAGFTGTMKSTMGAQALGRYKSQPIYGFGANTREQAQKVFVSQEHTALATAGKAGPGRAGQCSAGKALLFSPCCCRCLCPV